MIVAGALAIGQGAARLAPLREEIAIYRGPAALDGSPSWTLHDPICNRFYRLGWPEFEMLSRWEGESAESLLARLDSETTLRLERADVDDLVRFLSNADLLNATDSRATARLLEKAARQRRGMATWLLHNYLFMRIPLVRPDGFLQATYPFVSFVHSRAFAWLMLLAGMLGLYLIARQWDAFLATFIDLFSVDGAVLFAVTLACMKVVHELGHAYTAKRYGCRVPSMGVALLVFVPLLYTDVNDAWKLTKRRQRLAIGLAGVTAELYCAAIAACAWGFLPDGTGRSVAFLVMTTIWVATLLINLSPFMRFDGYYVLSDWLETPNLHARAFALARWRLRELVLGLGDPAPEMLPAARRRLFIAFAVATWTYRVALFAAIAVIVYHIAFKVLGIFLAAVEIWFFILAPVWREALVWWGRRGEVRCSLRSVASLAVLCALLTLLFVPWRSTIEAPAVLKSSQRVEVYTPDFGARVETVEAAHGDRVAAGTLLVRLTSPDLDYSLARAQSEIEILEWQIGAKGVDPGLLARSLVTAREYEAARAEYAGLVDRRSRLDVVAPIDGEVVDVAEGVTPGAWLAPKLRLMSVIVPDSEVVDAYIEEADLDRIRVGDEAAFFASADSRFELKLRVTSIERANTKVLADAALASVHGGPLAVREGPHKALVPIRTLYRVQLTPTGPLAGLQATRRGSVLLRGEATSLASRAWRGVLAVLIRESGA